MIYQCKMTPCVRANDDSADCNESCNDGLAGDDNDIINTESCTNGPKQLDNHITLN